MKEFMFKKRYSFANVMAILIIMTIMQFLVNRYL